VVAVHDEHFVVHRLVHFLLGLLLSLLLGLFLSLLLLLRNPLSLLLSLPLLLSLVLLLHPGNDATTSTVNKHTTEVVRYSDTTLRPRTSPVAAPASFALSVSLLSSPSHVASAVLCPRSSPSSCPASIATSSSVCCWSAVPSPARRALARFFFSRFLAFLAALCSSDSDLGDA
jgi:hypothetical protein